MTQQTMLILLGQSQAGVSATFGRCNTYSCCLKLTQYPLPSTGQLTGTKNLHPDSAHAHRHLRDAGLGREGPADLFHQGDGAGTMPRGQALPACFLGPALAPEHSRGWIFSHLPLSLSNFPDSSPTLSPAGQTEPRLNLSTANRHWTQQPPLGKSAAPFCALSPSVSSAFFASSWMPAAFPGCRTGLSGNARSYQEYILFV